MKKTVTLLCSLLIFPLCHGAATVDYLNVKGDTLYFSVNEAKTETSPDCAAVATSNRWAVSLNTQRGQSMYATLLTAVANQLPITVLSAGDCKDGVGIERPKSIALIAE